MPTISPFTPEGGKTVNVTASVASSNVVLPIGGGTQIRVCNPGSVTVFIAFGASTVTASATTDMPILAGQAEMFTVDFGSQLTYMAVATSATAGAAVPIYATEGEGF